jgi:hypothetical protein
MCSEMAFHCCACRFDGDGYVFCHQFCIEEQSKSGVILGIDTKQACEKVFHSKCET